MPRRRANAKLPGVPETPISPPGRLRRLIESGTPFVAADCYSALTGRVVEEAGFEAAYMGGHATSMMHYAIPDCGVFTPTEMIEQAGRVAEAITIPLIVDADQCGETVADVHRSVRRYGYVGVAGVHIEDEVNPKHSSWRGALQPIAEMQARLEAATGARRDPAFVVIARCDELYAEGGGGGGSLEETVRRGIAYAEAGADLFLPTFATDEQLEVIGAQVPIPLAGFGTLHPRLTIALATGWGVAAAVREHRRWALHLRQHGELPAEEFRFEGRESLIDQEIYDGVVRAWVQRTGRSPRSVP